MKHSSFYLLFFLPIYFIWQSEQYRWYQSVKPGNGSFEESWTPGKWPMAIFPVAGFNDDLYMVGRKYTWISSNGAHWKAYTKTNWGERYGMSINYFKGKLWMMGGMKTWDKFFNDIWSSNDGIQWKLVKQQAEWSERRDHCVMAFRDKLWLFGGGISSGANRTPVRSNYDTWFSIDGINWTQVSARVPWKATEIHATVFNSRLYIATGTDRHIWYSNDAVNWKSMPISWEPRRAFGFLAFDKKLWFFGGMDHNDCWYSGDGIKWSQQPIIPWSARTANHSIAFANKIWIYSGKTGREDSWSGDIWTMAKLNE